MKLKNLIICASIGLGICFANNLSAEILQNLTFTATTFSQRLILDNGTNTLSPAPKGQVHTTGDILKTLAQDKFAQNNWPSNSFPTAAKLAVGNDRFVVVLGTNVLVDVSDILSFTNGVNKIFSGKKNNLTGLSTPTTMKLQIGRLDFDDTAIIGGTGLKFYMQGLVTQTETDTVPLNGVYTQTATAKLSNGTGEGSSGADEFVLIGTLTATARGKETLSQ
jgi:hypothetical protein